MNNIVTNEDCMALMARYPDNHFDLAIVDPPYGIGADKQSIKPIFAKQKNGNLLKVSNTNSYKQKDWDTSIPKNEYFDELKRISVNQIIWGANYFGFSGGYLVWDKMNGLSDQFGCEMAYISFNRRTDIVYYLWQGMFQGLYCGKDIKKAMIQQGNKSLNEKRMHPTQKPIKLYEWLLINYAKQGDKILDTHLGSGSSRIAAYNLGFDFTACELDTEYFEAQEKRFKQHISQQRLF